MVTQQQGFFEFPIIQGLENKARNIFFHVPVAWTTVLAYFTALYYGYRYLKTKEIIYDHKSVSAAGLGLMFCILATITGSIWARFTWGSFWNWDPRETSIFILLLIYGAYFALRSAIEVAEKRATLSAVYSIIAGLTTPFFIFVLPRLVTGLHPGSKGDAAGRTPVQSLNMSGLMLITFLIGLVGFSLLFIWMLQLRIKTIELEHKSLWNQQ
jgi:heme exporter protein C